MRIDFWLLRFHKMQKPELKGPKEAVLIQEFVHEILCDIAWTSLENSVTVAVFQRRMWYLVLSLFVA